MKTASALALVVSAIVLHQAAAAPAKAVVWPGSVITYRDLTRGSAFHGPVAAAVAAWNRLALGVTLRRVSGRADLTISLVHSRCLHGPIRKPPSAGKAPRGFRNGGSHVVLSNSCPAVVRRLLIAHELGRALGLPIDNSRCSLMNRKAVSDGLTYVVPSKCPRRRRPRWLRSLIDPGSAALARTMYTRPLAPGAVGLSVTAEGLPQVGWSQPSDATAASTVVVRTPAACPTDRDVAAGTGVAVFAGGAVPGSHTLLDSSFPTSGQWCFRVFDLNRFGRASESPDAISYVFGGPVAGFTVSATPVAGTPTRFEDASTATHGSIVHWRWDFGDPPSGAANIVDTSNPTLGRTTSHVFGEAGTYQVTLTVTDTSGLTSSIIEDVLVGAGA